MLLLALPDTSHASPRPCIGHPHGGAPGRRRPSPWLDAPLLFLSIAAPTARRSQLPPPSRVHHFPGPPHILTSLRAHTHTHTRARESTQAHAYKHRQHSHRRMHRTQPRSTSTVDPLPPPFHRAAKQLPASAVCCPQRRSNIAPGSTPRALLLVRRVEHPAARDVLANLRRRNQRDGTHRVHSAHATHSGGQHDTAQGARRCVKGASSPTTYHPLRSQFTELLCSRVAVELSQTLADPFCLCCLSLPPTGWHMRTRF